MADAGNFSLPMMTGAGPFGGICMGGMFSVVKVRDSNGRDDYRDPGWYPHPRGGVAYEYAGAIDEAARGGAPQPSATLDARKPTGHVGH